MKPVPELAPHLLQPKERVLSTLQADGSRRWLRPRLSMGRFWQSRRIVAYILLAVYIFVPYIHVGGHPLILLDVVARRFHLFGTTFLPTDTKLLALLLLIAGLSIFTATAVLGRVFCGWACPQTVYLEFVFRPLERLFMGTTGKGGQPKKVAAWRYLAMYALYILISIHIAHTLMSYFIGVDKMHEYIWRSTPFQHPAAFVIVALVTLWFVWDFSYWREQMCIIGCPYGRMQSVLLDRGSLIVSYDAKRGEPRGKGARPKADALEARRVALDVAPTSDALGDCIDCSMCVQVCPTGIDIRDGLQLECVNCTQCIDACDAVMDKIDKPRGLVGYSSQAHRAGDDLKRIRPRVVLYPTLILILSTLFLYFLFTRPKFDLTTLRNPGKPFNVLADGRIENTLRFKIVNRTEGNRTYTTSAPDEDDIEVGVVDGLAEVRPLDTNMQIIRIAVEPDKFKSEHLDVMLRVQSSAGEVQERYVRLLGPTFHKGVHHE